MSNEDNAKSQAKALYESICDMVAALECDYDRLQELKDQKEANTALPTSDDLEFCDLMDAAGECESREDAELRIHEDALSVEVKTDWRAIDDKDQKPTHYNILICTGGPACRIMGELNEHSEPCHAWLEYQDWGTPWTQYFDADQDTLLAYARCFYFGE